MSFQGNNHGKMLAVPSAMLAESVSLGWDRAERTKQMEPILRAKVNFFFKSENLKKMLLIKNDGHIGFV